VGWQETREFLSKVVPWPGDNPGYVNLHYSIKDKENGKSFVTGKPFRDIDQFINFAQWARTTDNIKELWFCTSLQAEAGETAKGKPKATRLHHNARSLKAIWVDIDVKDDPKTYGSVEDAWSAITTFREEAGLPLPSAVVKSGGGLHLYWISDRPLMPQEWLKYAAGLRALLLSHGVKCDAGLTTDDVRLLRVPATLNFKYDPPRPVELLPLPLREYNFSQVLAFLTEVAPVAAYTPVSSLPAAFIGKTPLISGTDKLSDGIERQESLPLPFEPIVKGCAFIRDALATGGKDYTQPMWNLTTLAATFMEEGHGLAHKMAERHEGYSRESTELLWRRKLSERADRGIGWPGCNAIQASGCGTCAACPHLSAGKSPLNLGAGIIGGSQTVVAKPAGGLPKTYVHDKDGFICKVEEKESKGEVITLVHRLFNCKMDSFWAQKDANADTLHFRISYDKGNYVMASVTLADMCGGQIGAVLAKAKVKINPDAKRFLEGFFVALLTKLHEEMEAQETYPFGWLTQGTETKGFIYGGRVFRDDGTDAPAGTADPKLGRWYSPNGQLQPWIAACKTITDLQRPELDTLIAVAFAAPLMTCAGQDGITISAWGDSGSGKSSAMTVGLAVWGDPTKTKDSTDTTDKSILNKMGELRNLPTYWDEVTDEVSQARAVKISFTQTGGTEQGRMTANVQQRDRGSWSSMLAISANVSLVDLVIKKNPSHKGGINRVFEYHVDPNDPARLISPTDADRTFGALKRNYGMMGLEYTKFLATNYKMIDEAVSATRRKVETDLGSTQEERFWTAAIASLLSGARYANQLGASLNIELMERFLYSTFRLNRERSANEGSVGGSKENTEETLSAYLKSRAHAHTLWVDGIRGRVGQQSAVTILHCPPPNINSQEIHVVWDIPSRTLRISRKDLYHWLAAREIPIAHISRGLLKNYGAKSRKIVLAAGTTYKALPEMVLEVAVEPNSAMEDIMLQYKDMTAPAVVVAA
jgi:hypothetical protein